MTKVTQRFGRHSTIVQRTPPEVYDRIFSFACTDSGFTGQSLSLVSKLFRELSERRRLQSISLYGYEKLQDFAALLSRTPPHFCRVRYLFVSSYLKDGVHSSSTGKIKNTQGQPASQYDCKNQGREGVVARGTLNRRRRAERDIYEHSLDYEEKLCRSSMVATLGDILEVIAPSLEILEMDVNISTIFGAKKLVSLPHLTDLTCYRGYPFMEELFSLPECFSMTPSLRLLPCRSLRRLRIGDEPTSACTFVELSRSIRTFAPSLTHLYISCAWQDSSMSHCVGVALGLADSDPNIAGTICSLPLTMKKLLIARSRINYEDKNQSETFSSEFDKLRQMDSRIVLVDTKRRAKVGAQYLPASDSDWLARISGGEGCWYLAQ